MKIEKIEEGMVFKNYNALCDMLEVKPKRGDSKKAQLKQIESYFRLQKSGHSFTIMEVYKQQNEIIDNRGGSGVYNELLPLIITDYLLGREQSLHYITRNALLTNVQLINRNYSYGSKNRKEVSMRANVNEEVVHDFYNTSNSNFKSILETALNKLQKQRILRHFNVLMLMVENEKNKGLVEADNWTIEALLEFEKEALNDLGLQNMMQVRMNPYTWDRHSRLVVNKFNKEHPEIGLKYYFSSYKIIVNTKYIEEDHNRMLVQAMDKMERDSNRSKLNDMLCERLLENAKKRKAANASKNERLLQTRQSFSYVDDNQRLIELLVDRNCEIDIGKTSETPEDIVLSWHSK